MSIANKTIEVMIEVAASNLRHAREAKEAAEARLLKLLCDKFGCHPGMRVYRTDTKRVSHVWIVTKPFIKDYDSVTDLQGRPRVWAKRADHHNSHNPRHERQLWSNWEACEP